MKNIITLFSILLLLSSCQKDFLERTPKNKISSENFWQTEKDANLALMGCYQYLEGSVYDAYIEGYVDNAHCQYPWESKATIIAAGDITAESDFGYNYQGIRRFNYFLDNIEKAPIEEDLKKIYIAEVKTLRAWRYFNLAKRFGSVVLVTEYTTDAEKVRIEPTPEADVVKFTIDELAAAIADLPLEQDYKGRINKAAALTIKARIHLFYSQWSEAETASKQVMEMGYSLFKVNTLTDLDKADDYSKFINFDDDTDKEQFLKGLRSYEKLFWNENQRNVEVILEKEYLAESQWYYSSGINTLFLSNNAGGGWSSIVPTQELVNAYWTDEGATFTPPTPEQRATNYNSGSYNEDYLEEFKNRDTRLYASILFPGNMWNTLEKNLVFSWTKGSSNTSKTGYNFRKMVDPTVSLSMWNAPQNFPVIRYAEILLNYAEAKNEVSGPDASIYDALDQIRERVAMPKINRTEINTKDLLREVIRNERRIELAAEGFRWDDIRRWNIIGDVMKSIKSIDNDLAQERKWDDKFKRLPYPQTAIDRNPNLKGAQEAKGY